MEDYEWHTTQTLFTSARTCGVNRVVLTKCILGYTNSINSTTGLLNNECLNCVIKYSIYEPSVYAWVAIASLTVGSYAQIKSEMGADFAEEALRLVSKQITPKLRQSDIIGHLDEKTYLLFLPLNRRRDLAPFIQSLRFSIATIPNQFDGTQIKLSTIGYHDDTQDKPIGFWKEPEIST